MIFTWPKGRNKGIVRATIIGKNEIGLSRPEHPNDQDSTFTDTIPLDIWVQITEWAKAETNRMARPELTPQLDWIDVAYRQGGGEPPIAAFVSCLNLHWQFDKVARVEEESLFLVGRYKRVVQLVKPIIHASRPVVPFQGGFGSQVVQFTEPSR